MEDGTLADDALNWTSSLSGVLGSGRILAVSGLPVGIHVITLVAMDSDGNTAIASVSVHVGCKVFLPTVLRNR